MRYQTKSGAQSVSQIRDKYSRKWHESSQDIRSFPILIVIVTFSLILICYGLYSVAHGAEQLPCRLQILHIYDSNQLARNDNKLDRLDILLVYQANFTDPEQEHATKRFYCHDHYNLDSDEAHPLPEVGQTVGGFCSRTYNCHLHQTMFYPYLGVYIILLLGLVFYIPLLLSVLWKSYKDRHEAQNKLNVIDNGLDAICVN